MDSVLKTDTVEVPSLGRKLAIRELSAGAVIEVIEAQREGQDIRAGAIACKHGVDEWRKEEVDAILENLTAAVILEVAGLITELSEGDSKNSESGPSDGLRSVSP